VYSISYPPNTGGLNKCFHFIIIVKIDILQRNIFSPCSFPLTYMKWVSFCHRKDFWLAETVALPQHACFAMLLCLLNAVGRGYSLGNGRKYTKYNEGINYFCEVRVHRMLMRCLQTDRKMDADSFDIKADGGFWRQIIRFSGQSWGPKTGISSLSMSSLKKIYYLR
jgi:hypothetical protein